METGYPEGVASLVVLADGTVSIYLSHGGGILGAGEDDSIRNAATSLLSFAKPFAKHMRITRIHPLPQTAYTRFYMLTAAGVLTDEAVEEDLGNDRHPLSLLFHGCHRLISMVIEID